MERGIDMGRWYRPQAAEIMFHVINRGNARQTLFASRKDFSEYLDLLKKYKEKFFMKIYHYVLMPNHVHLLLEPTLPGTISGFMQGLTLAHTRRSNLRTGKSGHVWQGRFKSIIVQNDSHFLQCGRYIELNPVRAKIVVHPSAYRWSSYRSRFDGQDHFLDDHPMYEIFRGKNGGFSSSYKNFIAAGMPSAQSRPLQRFSQEAVYGDRHFIRRMEQEGYIRQFSRRNCG